MPTFLLICAVAVGLWLLHRLALWAEQRGWIYYVRKKARLDSLGSAVLELQQMAEPAKKHLIQAKRAQRLEQNGEAGPDDPMRHLRGPDERR